MCIRDRYAQMQQLEDEIPRAIKRLEKNESSLDVINKDLRYLEGEKVQFDIDCLLYTSRCV